MKCGVLLFSGRLERRWKGKRSKSYHCKQCGGRHWWSAERNHVFCLICSWNWIRKRLRTFLRSLKKMWLNFKCPLLAVVSYWYLVCYKPQRVPPFTWLCRKVVCGIGVVTVQGEEGKKKKEKGERKEKNVFFEWLKKNSRRSMGSNRVAALHAGRAGYSFDREGARAG